MGNSYTPQSLLDYAIGQANAYNVPPALFGDMLYAESGFNANAYNAASGATGVAQFLPSTAASPGYGIAPFDPTDPLASISAAAQYMAALFNKYGSWTGAANAYSGRPQGSTPYPGNANIAYDLATLDGGSSPGTAPGSASPAAPAGTAAGAGQGAATTAGTGTTAGAQQSGWLASLANFFDWGKIGGYLQNIAGRTGLGLLGVILIVGAIALFAFRTAEVNLNYAEGGSGKNPPL